MTLAQMISDIYMDHGNDFQVEPADILRHISAVQEMAFARDCAAFEERAAVTWVEATGAGPYAWPAAARSIIAVEDVDGNPLAASMQLIRRTLTLAVDPGQNFYVRYYIKPETLATNSDDTKVLVPSEWHYPVLVQGAVLLCEAASYGEKASVPDLGNVLAPFWDAMDSSMNTSGDIGSSAFLSSVGAW